jgi:hypothetical protein
VVSVLFRTIFDSENLCAKLPSGIKKKCRFFLEAALSVCLPLSWGQKPVFGKQKMRAESFIRPHLLCHKAVPNLEVSTSIWEHGIGFRIKRKVGLPTQVW